MAYVRKPHCWGSGKARHFFRDGIGSHIDVARKMARLGQPGSSRAADGAFEISLSSSTWRVARYQVHGCRELQVLCSKRFVISSSHKLRTETSAPTPCAGALVRAAGAHFKAFVYWPSTEQTQHRSGAGRFLFRHYCNNWPTRNCRTRFCAVIEGQKRVEYSGRTELRPSKRCCTLNSPRFNQRELSCGCASAKCCGRARLSRCRRMASALPAPHRSVSTMFA